MRVTNKGNTEKSRCQRIVTRSFLYGSGTGLSALAREAYLD